MASAATEPGLTFRPAQRSDVPAIVRLLADDELGATRELATEPLPQRYYAAFAAIKRDVSNELIVVEAAGTAHIIDTLQLTFIPSLTYRGGTRAQIEAVRIDRRFRGHGVGRALFAWALARSRERGCQLVQLTTDKHRPGARRFYERLGFVASHEGMKLHLR